MTKVYELPDNHRMIADIDETTRICTITETQLDSLVSKLNYYAEGHDEVLDKIRAEIDEQIKYNTYFNSDMAKGEIIAFEWVKRKIDEYTKGEGE